MTLVRPEPLWPVRSNPTTESRSMIVRHHMNSCWRDRDSRPKPLRCSRADGRQQCDRYVNTVILSAKLLYAHAMITNVNTESSNLFVYRSVAMNPTSRVQGCQSTQGSFNQIYSCRQLKKPIPVVWTPLSKKSLGYGWPGMRVFLHKGDSFRQDPNAFGEQNPM